MDTSTAFTAKSRKVLSPTREVPPEQVQPCDFRAIGALDRERLAPMLAANEAFAHMLTEVLSRKLRFKCEVSLQSCDQRPSASFLGKSGIANYILSVLFEAHHEPAFLQIEPQLLLPVIDLLLGGSGKAGDAEREITELEDQVVREFARILCQVLQSAWHGFKAQIRLGERGFAEELQKTSFAAAQVVACGFNVNLLEAGTQGECRLLMPVSTAMAFLRGTPPEQSTQASVDHGAISSRFAEKILAANFKLELSLCEGKAQATDLLSLDVGKILKLDVPVRTSAVLRVGNRDTFRATPVRSGRQKGAQLVGRLPDTLQEMRNSR